MSEPTPEEVALQIESSLAGVILGHPGINHLAVLSAAIRAAEQRGREQAKMKAFASLKDEWLRGRRKGWEEAREACRLAVCAGADTDSANNSTMYRFGIRDAVKAIDALTLPEGK